MKGYKAFDKDLTCRGFQYEVGKTYWLTGPPVMCELGFHFCESLWQCYLWYPKSLDTCICEVEAPDPIAGTTFDVMEIVREHDAINEYGVSYRTCEPVMVSHEWLSRIMEVWQGNPGLWVSLMDPSSYRQYPKIVTNALTVVRRLSIEEIFDKLRTEADGNSGSGPKHVLNGMLDAMNKALALAREE